MKVKSRQERSKYLTKEDLTLLLCQAADDGRFKLVYLLLDALDELDAEERDKLLSVLHEISQHPRIRVLITGRDNAGVRDSVDRLLSCASPPIGVEYLSITPMANSADLRHFLELKLKNDRYPRLMDDRLREKIFLQLAGPGST